MSYRNFWKLARLPLRRNQFLSDPFFRDPFHNDPFFSDPFFSRSRDPFFIDIIDTPDFHQQSERMNEALNKISEAFEILSDPSYTPKQTKQQSIEGQESKKLSEKSGKETLDKKEAQTIKMDKTETSKQEQPAEQNTEESKTAPLETQEKTVQPREMINDLAYWLDPVWGGFERSNQTYARAEKLFEDVMKNEKPTLEMQETDELLKGKDEFKDFAQLFGNENSKFTGSSYQSSTIFKNGKAVTVSRYSKLNPDGTIKTEVNQEFVDPHGQKDSRTWVKEDNFFEKVEAEGEKKQLNDSQEKL
jgi:hypothetical protein